MITTEMLIDRLSEADIRLLLQKHGLEKEPLSGKRAREALAARLSDPAYLPGAIRRLREPAQLLLRAVLVTEEHWETERVVERSFPRQYRPVTQELRTLGFVSSYGDVPAEVQRASCHLWAADLVCTPKLESVREPDPTGPGLLRDVAALLAMAERHELPVTQQGAVYKKTADELNERLECCLSTNNGLKVSLALNYATGRQLLTVVEAGGDSRAKWKLAPAEDAARWVEQGPADLWADVAGYILEKFDSVFPATRSVLQMLGAIGSDQWLRLTPWAKEMDRLAGDHPQHGTATGSKLKSLFAWLTATGLVQWVEAPVIGPVVRPTAALRALLDGQNPPLPDREAGFYVQPNYEILAPRTLPLPVIYQLERFAGNRRADQALQYTLSAGSLVPALEAGADPGEIIAFFRENSRNPLPPNVLSALQDWTASAPRARLEAVTLLRLETPATAAKLLSDRTLKPLIVGQLTPVDLIVDSGAAERIRKRLGELGVVLSSAPQAKKAGQKRRQDEDHFAMAGPEEFCSDWVDCPVAPLPELEVASPAVSPPTPASGQPQQAGKAQKAGKAANAVLTPRNQSQCAEWLRSAAAAREVIRIQYESDGGNRWVQVHPQRVLDDRLLADCPELGGSRKFKLARIIGLQMTGERF